MLLKPYFRQILALGSEVMDTNILVMNPSLKSHHMFEWNKHMNYYYDKYIHEHDIDDPVEEEKEDYSGQEVTSYLCSYYHTSIVNGFKTACEAGRYCLINDNNNRSFMW